MYKAKITKAEKIRHQATNSEFLEVSFNIIDEEENIQTSKRIGMDINSTKEDIVKEVNNHIAEHGREVENAELDAEKEKANANIKDIQKNLVGSTIEPETEKVETPANN